MSPPVLARLERGMAPITTQRFRGPSWRRFIEREQEFLQGGGKFIVPLPEVRVVGAS